MKGLIVRVSNRQAGSSGEGIIYSPGTGSLSRPGGDRELSPGLGIAVADGAACINAVATALDQLVSAGEVVSRRKEARFQLVFQLVAQGTVRGGLDEIVLLEGIFLIVEEFPGPLKATSVGVAPGAYSPVFASPLGAGPLAKGTGAGDGLPEEETSGD